MINDVQIRRNEVEKGLEVLPYDDDCRRNEYDRYTLQTSELNLDKHKQIRSNDNEVHGQFVYLHTKWCAIFRTNAVRCSIAHQ